VSQRIPPPQRANLYREQPRRFGPWLKLIAWTMVLGILGTLGYVLWTLRDMPDPGNRPVLAHSIVIYDRNGKQIEQRNPEGAYYLELPLQQLGTLGPAATLAAEDRDFYHHGPIDYRGTARAALQDLVHAAPDQGGSTITQQLVKIEVLTPQKSIFRKMQEAILATALEQRYSKDQILEMYLNRVFYGHNAYGLGAAAKIYFGKQPKDLTAAQAAFLAGLINGPSYFDPLSHYDRAHDRELYVLGGMVKMGTLTQAQADQAAKEDVKSELKFDESFRRSAAPHFVDYVLGQLEQTVGHEAVQQGGFAVHTTLDLDLQTSAQKAVQQGVAALKRTGVNNGDLLAVNPKTGEILAYVGSADYYNNNIGGQFDVIRSPRQPGSSFKPYVFEAALRDHKITLSTILRDEPTNFGNGYRPLDYDNRFMGDMTARRALVLSRNVPAVEVGQMEGIDNVINLVGSMGINRAELKPYPSTAIGASPITMRENVQGYQVFANQGTLVPLMSITKITDAQGNVIFQRQPGQQDGVRQLLTPADTYLITDTLKSYQNVWDLGFRRQMASKSGTTGGAATGVHGDAWMMAYNPDIVVGAWAGNTAPDGGGKTISTFGTDVGQHILAPFINTLPANMKGWYQRPDGIVTGPGCATEGGAAGEIYLAGTERGVDCPTPTPTPSPTDETNGDNNDNGQNGLDNGGLGSGNGFDNGSGGVGVSPGVGPTPSRRHRGSSGGQGGLGDVSGSQGSPSNNLPLLPGGQGTRGSNGGGG
jgi:membrane peptidoglycan carboxypeptidase